MRIIFFILLFSFGFYSSLISQEIEEKFIQSNGIKLHYLDFGGDGIPMIFMQSFHEDAFEWYTGEMAGIAEEHIPNYRVFAVTRRGWGKSDDPGWGYDVATQAEDLLGFMAALDLKKAILVGRIPANQDMIWIAEHHPERISALIMIGNPVMGLNSTDPEIQKYQNELLAMSWDLGEQALAKRGPRNTWRPHFLEDSTQRINIPTLRFLSARDVEALPGGRNVYYLDRTIRQVSAPDFKPWNVRVAHAANYFLELGRDSLRKEAIQSYLIQNDPGPELREGLERALGHYLKTLWEPEIPEETDYDEFWITVYVPFFVSEIKAFLEEKIELRAD